MKILRILVNGFFLTLIDFGAILIGFAIYCLMGRPGDPIAIEATLAAVLTIVGYPLFCLGVRSYRKGAWLPWDRYDFVGTYVLAFLWFPVLFVPLHFVRHGYLTAFRNIWMTWLFLAPTNLLALLATHRYQRCRKERYTT